MDIKFRLDPRRPAVGRLIHQQRIQDGIAAVVQVQQPGRGDLLGILLQVGACGGVGRQAADHRRMVIDIMLHFPDLLLLLLQQRIIALLHFGGLQPGTQLGVFVHPPHHDKQRQIPQNSQHQCGDPVGVINGGGYHPCVQHHRDKEQDELRSGNEDKRQDIQPGVAVLHQPDEPDGDPAKAEDEDLRGEDGGVKIPHAAGVVQHIVVHKIGDEPNGHGVAQAHAQNLDDLFKEEHQKPHGDAAVEYHKQVNQLHGKVEQRQRKEDGAGVKAGDLPQIADGDQCGIHQQRDPDDILPVLIFRLKGDKRMDEPHENKGDKVIDKAVYRVGKKV